MRTVGIAILGVVIGLAVGLALFHEVLSRLLVSAGTNIGVGLGLVIAFGPIVLAIIGGPVAVAIDRRRRTRGGRA
ncbi:MAG: hypothetical protein J2P23_00720 [Microlunatus sp.]|nr:hypothetical protein [Microlunatus sp.]